MIWFINFVSKLDENEVVKYLKIKLVDLLIFSKSVEEKNSQFSNEFGDAIIQLESIIKKLSPPSQVQNDKQSIFRFFGF